MLAKWTTYKRKNVFTILFSITLFFIIPAASAQLVNGGSITGSLSFDGQEVPYTFDASANESVWFQINDVANEGLWPRLKLSGPGLDTITHNGSRVAQISETLLQTGTYTITVTGSTGIGALQVGPYELHFVKAPGANEGGKISDADFINDHHIFDRINIADIDSYTFDLKKGETARIRAANVGPDYLWPIMRLYSPSGDFKALNASSSGLLTIEHTASDTDPDEGAGTYTIALASTLSLATANVGDYHLYFAKAPADDVVRLLSKSEKIPETIFPGDIDSYRFKAKAGESIQVRAATIDNGDLTPEILFYDPDGARIFPPRTGAYGVSRLSYGIVEDGEYTIIIDSGGAFPTNASDYDFYFEQMPDESDNVPRLSNGPAINGEIELGELDKYTFEGTVGQKIKIGLTVPNQGTEFTPRMTIYDPEGGVIIRDDAFWNFPAEIEYELEQNGTYNLIIADAHFTLRQTGEYELGFEKKSLTEEECARIATACLQTRFDDQTNRCLTDDGQSFNKDFWNDGPNKPVQSSNNCYNYAMNRYNPPEGGQPRAQPGKGGGNTIDLPKTCEDYIEKAKLDLRSKPLSNCDIPCSSGSRKIALTVFPGEDYHWYREDKPGEWSHKRGGHPATDRDGDVNELGNKITDPSSKTTNRTYTLPDGSIAEYKFCACFCTSPACNEIIK